MFQGMNLWYKTKKMPPSGLNLCALNGRGWQRGSTLFPFHLAAADVCWALSYSCEKLSVLMQSTQFR